MNQRIYISSPITGMPNGNRDAFLLANALLVTAGYMVVNPIFNGLPNYAPWSAHMREDIKQLMDCHGVATLPGTMGSQGAKLELHIARTLAMPVMTVEQWVQQAQSLAQCHAENAHLEAA